MSVHLYIADVMYGKHARPICVHGMHVLSFSIHRARVRTSCMYLEGVNALLSCVQVIANFSVFNRIGALPCG
jgi:hypothetical protein